MNGEFFDAIARFQDAIQNRRSALRALLAALAAPVAAASADIVDAANRNRKKRRRRRRRRRNRRKKQCPAGQTRCSGQCVDTSTDPQNCGSCGHDCDTGETCKQGVCGCDVCDGANCPFTTVQAAIDAASSGDTIHVCPGTYTENVTVDKNLTIIGAGSDNTTLHGTGDGSVVTIEEDVAATIQNLLITGGIGTLDVGARVGGGVLNLGATTLKDCFLSENVARFGGAIYNATGGRLTLNNTELEANQATDPEERTFGGGLYNDLGAEANLTSSRIDENQAHNGGGIYNAGVLKVSNASVIFDNVVDFDGGGILNDAQGEVTIDGSTVESNKAAGTGGGILNFTGTLTLQNNSEVGANEAAQGGGVFNQGPGTMTATDSAITNNKATLGGGVFNGGGAVTLNASTIFENDASDTGGGIFNTQGGVVTLDAQSAVVDNDPNNCVGTTACLG